jgi:hypothetical protein
MNAVLARRLVVKDQPVGALSSRSERFTPSALAALHTRWAVDTANIMTA